MTGPGCGTRIYTYLAVVGVTAECFLVREITCGLSREERQARMAAPLAFADDCKEMAVGV